jgi:hypothetical protein
MCDVPSILLLLLLLLLFGVLWAFKTLFAYSSTLTLNPLTTTIVAPPTNVSKWQMGFNSAFKGLNCSLIETDFISLHNFIIFIWQEIMDFYVLAAYLVSDRFASTERSHN